MTLPISKEEADFLIETQKRIDHEIKWSKDTEHFLEFRVPIRVEALPHAKLILKGSTNKTLHRHTFAIIYNSSARIKALDIGQYHKNKCPNHKRERIGPKHKHSWQDCCKDQWVYVPDDITDGASFEQVFREFLTECNIDYSGDFPARPTTQMEMVLDELFND